jgi:hypothetical protein
MSNTPLARALLALAGQESDEALRDWFVRMADAAQTRPPGTAMSGRTGRRGGASPAVEKRRAHQHFTAKGQI